MNVAQNVSAIFNSPQWAEVNLQAVQAGDLALRQFEEAHKRDAARRESQVTGTDPSMPFGVVDSKGEATASEPRRPARRGARSTARPQTKPETSTPPPSDGGIHRVDLVI